jgi:hypothetical protein
MNQPDDTTRNWNKFEKRHLRWVYWGTRLKITTTHPNSHLMTRRSYVVFAMSWWVDFCCFLIGIGGLFKRSWWSFSWIYRLRAKIDSPNPFVPKEIEGWLDYLSPLLNLSDKDFRWIYCEPVTHTGDGSLWKWVGFKKPTQSLVH